jgi:hypothetical protein
MSAAKLRLLLIVVPPVNATAAQKTGPQMPFRDT